jgi:signal transduction histidine kinase
MKNRSLARTIEDLRRRVLGLQQRAGRTTPATGLRPESFNAVVASLDELDRRIDQRTAELRASEQSLRKLNTSLRMVSDCNDSLVHAVDESELLVHLCRIIVDVGGYRLAWVGYREDDAAAALRPVASAGFEPGCLEAMDLTWADTPVGQTCAAIAVRTGRPCVARSEPKSRQAKAWRALAKRYGYSSTAAVPLLAGGRVLGALSIHAAEPEAFDEAEVRLLMELADDLAYGVTALRTRAARQRAEEALKEQAGVLEAERLRLFSVLNMLPGFVLLHDADHKIRFANYRFLDLFGNPTGKPCYEVLRGRDNPCDLCPAADIFASGKPREWEWTNQHGRDFRVWAYPFSEIDGTLSVLQLGIDITERREMEKEILEAASEEQRRIGRDVHDVLGQNLTGIAFLSKALARRLLAAGSPDAGPAQEIATLCNQAVAQARTISHGLCPVDVTAEGLMEALGEMADGVQRLYGFPCEFGCAVPIRVFNSAIAANLYHIAREAVNNAVKHARPKHIRVTLAEQDRTVTLTVCDDGVGISEGPPPRGMGLRIMSYRADMIGAALKVEPAEGGGTLVVCRLPNDRLAEKR